MTAALGLYRQLKLPEPWLLPIPTGFPGNETPAPEPEPLPLIIYGASSAVGFYALQFAKRSKIHPLLCVAGRAGKDYILPFLDESKGDRLIDYRDGDEAVVEALIKAAPLDKDGNKIPILHAMDAVSENGSPVNIAKVFAANPTPPQGQKKEIPKVTFVLWGPKEGVPDDGSVEHSITMVGSAHSHCKDFAHVFYRYMSRGLSEGWFRPQRTEVIPGGLGGVQTALENLKAGKASGMKYVVRIGDTEGVTL